MRLFDLQETTFDSGYTDIFYDTMISLWNMGKPVNPETVSPDADTHFEDHEWDYEWRYTMVPISLFPDYDDWAESPEATEEKFQFLRDNPSIFKTNPLLIHLDFESGLMPLMDGHHRVTVAKELGINQLPAIIGAPEERDF